MRVNVIKREKKDRINCQSSKHNSTLVFHCFKRRPLCVRQCVCVRTHTLTFRPIPSQPIVYVFSSASRAVDFSRVHCCRRFIVFVCRRRRRLSFSHTMCSYRFVFLLQYIPYILPLLAERSQQCL